MLELLARTVAFAGLVALAFAPLERRRRLHAPRRSGFATDIAFATVGQALVRAGVFVIAGAALAALDMVALSEPLLAGLDQPVRGIATVVIGLLLFELASYGYHRLAHAVPWMWRLHEVHHSSESMDWLASFRQHPVEIVLMTLAQNAPLVLLGVPLASHAAILVLLRLHTVFVHANLRVAGGAWTHLIASPQFHHRHHARGGSVRNYASLFPFLDRLFGTHTSEQSADFGLERPAPRGFVGLMLLPLRRRPQ